MEDTNYKFKKMQICHFFTKSSKTWLRNSKVVHSKQLARIAKVIFDNNNKFANTVK